MSLDVLIGEVYMNQRVKRALVAGVVAVVGTASVTAMAADKKKASVKVVNQSDWSIDKLFMSPVNESKWGPDQFGDEVVEKGETFTLTDVPCDTWDVKLVDEDGDVCIVEDVDICASSETWTITSKDLLKCQKATDAKDDDDDDE